MLPTDIHPAPTPFKWTRSATPADDTSTKFKEAQKDSVVVEKINQLINRSIDSAESVAQLNKDVIDTYIQLASSVTTKRSGKRSQPTIPWQTLP